MDACVDPTTTIMNSSFEERQTGQESFVSVCKAFGWRQYHRFRPRAGMTVEQDLQCLDLRRFADNVPEGSSNIPCPRRYRSLREFQSAADLSYNEQQIPIAIIGYKNVNEKNEFLAKAAADGRTSSGSCTTGYSFLGGVTFASLTRAFTCVDPKQMWLCAMVLDHAPVHLYFDFDATVSARVDRQDSAAQALAKLVQGQEAAVKQEFLETFSAFFARIYNRPPNWSGLHWETASDRSTGKFSLHAHVTTEAFVNIKHMHRFMGEFAEFLTQQSAQGMMQWLQYHKNDNTSASLLDAAVYTPNRVFRLIGCRKPGKTPLTPLPSSTEEASLSWEELVFRGMPSLSIDVDDAQLLTHEPVSHQSNRKRKLAVHGDATEPTNVRKKTTSISSVSLGSEDTSVAIQTIIKDVCIGLFELGPAVQVQHCQTIHLHPHNDKPNQRSQDRRYEGEFVLGSAWCPNMTKIDVMTLTAAPHIHEHTAMAFCVTAHAITVMDFRCGIAKKKRFIPNLSRTNVSQQQWNSLFYSDVAESDMIVAPPGSTPGQNDCITQPLPVPDIMIIDTLSDGLVQEIPGQMIPVSTELDQGTETDVNVHVMAPGPVTSTAASNGDSEHPTFDVALNSVQENETQEMQPSLETIRQIIVQHSDRHRATLQELKLKMHLASSHGDAHAVSQCEEVAVAMETSLLEEVVQYCNRFWGKFMRLGKPWMVQELGAMGKDGRTTLWSPTFNSLKHLEELYSDLNVEIPSYLDLSQSAGARPAASRRHRTAKTNVATLWLAHPASRKLNGIEFNPQREVTRFRDLSSNIACDYNLWRGFAVPEETAMAYAATAALTPHPVDVWTRPDVLMQRMVQPILQHIRDVWCKSDQRSFAYVMGWMANVVQKRCKNGTALVVKGPQGAGKGVIVQKLGDVIGRDHYFHAHNIDDVLGTYTHNIRAACLVFLDEVTYGGNHEQAQRCKKLVTEPTHINNAKFQPSFTVDSYVNVIIASNSEFVVPCETQQRRFFALEVDDTYSGRQDDRLKAYYDAILSVPPEAFAYMLYNYDLSDFNPRQIHSTDFERNQKMRSFRPMMAWWHDCLEENEIEAVRIVHDQLHGGPMNSAQERGQSISAFDSLVVKDSVYDSFTAFCIRNRRSNTYHVTAKNEFWKLLDSWTQTPERKQLGMRLTTPEMKRQVEVMGQLQWSRVVAIPSLEECRRAWRTTVVRDEHWTFQGEEVAGPDRNVEREIQNLLQRNDA